MKIINGKVEATPAPPPVSASSSRIEPKMKPCPECHAQMPVNARRCPACGTVHNLQASAWIVWIAVGIGAVLFVIAQMTN